MSKVKKLRNEIKSKIEVIKKINDNPKLAVDDLYDLYGDGVTNVDKLLQSKVDGLKSKLKEKKTTKQTSLVLLSMLLQVSLTTSPKTL